MKYSFRITFSLFIALSFAMSAFAQSSPRRIEIHARRFSFIPAEITVEKGEPVSVATALEEIRERDRRDTEREVSPLVRATDAVLVDNTAMDVEETARLIVLLAHEREAKLSKDAGAVA